MTKKGQWKSVAQ